MGDKIIRVDSRVGSKELAPLIDAYGSGARVKTKLTRLKYGDFSFPGNGPHGECSVAVERKRLTDLLNSIRTGRLTAHQIPGLLNTYDYVWLVVEGLFRGDPDTGLLECPRRGKWVPVSVGRSRFLFSEVDNFLTSISVQTPVKVRVTADIHQTALFLLDLFKWWGKDWEGHKSCKVLHDPFPARAYMVKPTLVRRMAMQIPGVGWEKSVGIDEEFSTPAEMCVASESTWRKLPGIGDTLSTQIVRALNSTEDCGGEKE